MSYAAQAAENLIRIRSEKPLVHNITNFVVMNFTANALLATGASPVMAHADNEVEEMVGFAGALVLNIGTLTDIWVDSMVKAGKKAAESGTPVILDPVGAGATSLRTNASRRLLAEIPVKIVRGNSSEILSLGGGQANTRGVDAGDSVEAATAAAVKLADELQTTLAVTGPEDLITDGSRALRVANGHEFMPLVTGTGCAATAIIGAFAAVEPDPLLAAAQALAFYGLAGEQAAVRADGPGSFSVALMDALYHLSPEQLAESARIMEARIG
ncbi:MAG: hydroxyethylthiazole kinase [Deltaproteobacteria bacterium]|nr:MAG: hydroxyethylthiazole kinase [Deltaproteobacteria bacterium]